MRLPGLSTRSSGLSLRLPGLSQRLPSLSMRLPGLQTSRRRPPKPKLLTRYCRRRPGREKKLFRGS